MIRSAAPYAAVCAVVMLTIGCTAAQQRQAQGSVNDALISAQVEAKIAAIDTAAVSLVHVQVKSGIVTLTGDVHSKTERQLILAATHDVGGVTTVFDHLHVNPHAATTQQIENDVALQTRVKTALTEQTGVNAFRVQVAAHNGDVELNGDVASATVHALVLETVKAVPGVKRVRDHLRVSRT